MGAFSKTLIVDLDHVEVEGQYYQTIENAAKYFRDHTIGGTIIVESGEYTIASLSDTVFIPSNVTLIGSGNVVVNVTSNQTAFTNSDHINGNNNITLTGFKIVVTDDVDTNEYEGQVIDLRNVTNCILEKLYITTTNPQNEVARLEGQEYISNSAIYLHYSTNSR